MGVETGVTGVDDLNASWPLNSDPKSEGAQHIRNVKTAVKADVASNIDRITQNESDIAGLQLFVGLSPDRIDWGNVSAAGAINGGNGGWNVSKIGTGKYRINFTDTPASHLNNALLITCKATIGFVTANYDWVDSNTVDIQTGFTSSNAAADNAFSFYRAVRYPQ